MINIQQTLSPILAALLLKEFTTEQIAEWGEQGEFDANRDRPKIDRFMLGLEEHRLDLSGNVDQGDFCSVILCYLEALLDPGTDALMCSGIEVTASAATTVWNEMSDVQRTALWQEAGRLHAAIVSWV